MARNLSDAQLAQLKAAHDELGALIDSIESDDSQPDGEPAAPRPPDPGYMAKYRQWWGFLKAVEDAGGRLLPKQLSVIAQDHGYEPRGLGGFYTGNGALRRDGEYRELTDFGTRFIRQWEDEFGGS
jgi:hypothetical protein